MRRVLGDIVVCLAAMALLAWAYATYRQFLLLDTRLTLMTRHQQQDARCAQQLELVLRGNAEQGTRLTAIHELVEAQQGDLQTVLLRLERLLIAPATPPPGERHEPSVETPGVPGEDDMDPT